MSRPFQPSSQRARAAFAVVAVLVSVTIAALVDGLAEHYRGGVLAQAPAAATQA